MAVGILLRNEVSDLCLGKPALRLLTTTATIADAISLLRHNSGDPYVSIWSVSGQCAGIISIVDILCFLCRADHVSRFFDLIHLPVSRIIDLKKSESGNRVVKHLEPSSSVLEAVDCILEGAYSFIVPKKTRTCESPRKPLPKGPQFCWITQEDVIRFFLNSINHFSPMAAQSIQSLNIIEENILRVHYDHPALSALSAINSSDGLTAVAVVDDEGSLLGEISVYTLACCDETVAPAVATLSAGDVLAYVDYGGPPDDLIQLVKQRLKDMNLDGLLELLDEDYHYSSKPSVSSPLNSSSSSDDELGSAKRVPYRSSSGGFVRGMEPIVCHPGSSLVAVMIQALAHRLNYVWVIEHDYSLVGMVTFAGMLKAFRDRVPALS